MKGVWEAIWGLLVEDGSLAIGIVAALTISWLAAVVFSDAARDQVGWLLLALLVGLVLANLGAAAQSVRRGTS